MNMAEGVGFEPTDPCGSPVFKTGALNHSAIPPSCLLLATYVGNSTPRIGLDSDLASCQPLPNSGKYANQSERHAGSCEYYRTKATGTTSTISTVSKSTGSANACLSAQSLNNFRTVVSGLFEYAVKRALISRNPMRAVERVKAVDKPPGIFTPEELKKLL